MWALVWGLLFNKSVMIHISELKTVQESTKSGTAETKIAEIETNDSEITTAKTKKIIQQNNDNTPNLQAVLESNQPVIRVLLMTTDYKNYEHSEVSGICNGEDFSYTAESPELGSSPVILDGGETGITLTSIERQCGQPVYYGTLEIIKNGTALNLINEVPLEAYLESVVPSEMPASYEPQALMAQAVCARTYAWKHLLREEMNGYSANVDDSVNYQVYGNVSPQERTTKAVKDTMGKILCQNDEPVDTYYFSTSAGVTSTDEIWGAEKAAPHLKSVECTFDEEYPWSKWTVVIPWEHLQENAEIFTGNSSDLTGLEIQKKSQSGAVTGLQVDTENSSFVVETEYEVRKFLSPKGCIIEEKDGSRAEGGALLPSAYFSIKEYPGEKIILTGGGYGHGVGMSQNGANQMAKEGYSFEEILEYFFKDTELRVWTDDCLSDR